MTDTARASVAEPEPVAERPAEFIPEDPDVHAMSAPAPGPFPQPASLLVSVPEPEAVIDMARASVAEPEPVAERPAEIIPEDPDGQTMLGVSDEGPSLREAPHETLHKALHEAPRDPPALAAPAPVVTLDSVPPSEPVRLSDQNPVPAVMASPTPSPVPPPPAETPGILERIVRRVTRFFKSLFR